MKYGKNINWPLVLFVALVIGAAIWYTQKEKTETVEETL